jgi:protein SCO1
MSTSCDTISEAISARADHEDPGVEADVIDRHLATCPACAEFADGIEELRRRMGVVPTGVVPDLGSRIMAAIPEGPAPRRRFSDGHSLSGPGLALVGIAAAVVLVAAFLGGRALAGGGGGGGSNGVASVQQVAGSNQASATYPGATVLPQRYALAYHKPDVTLTDTEGQPYNMATATAGKVTLLYFGYTHCPDVCPINMALAAQALAAMPASERQEVTVVFITTDPNRDTPPVIRSWLNNFSPSFVGLTGTIAQIDEAEKDAGLPLSTVGPAVDGDGYSITHAGYTLAFSQDNEAHLQIDVSEVAKDYTTTLEHLVTHGYQVH